MFHLIEHNNDKNLKRYELGSLKIVVLISFTFILIVYGEIFVSTGFNGKNILGCVTYVLIVLFKYLQLAIYLKIIFNFIKIKIPFLDILCQTGIVTMPYNTSRFILRILAVKELIEFNLYAKITAVLLLWVAINIFFFLKSYNMKNFSAVIFTVIFCLMS